MSGKIFQNVILQLKGTTEATIGVMDSEGTVIACTDLSLIGQHWPEFVQPLQDAGDNGITLDGKSFRVLGGWVGSFDYAVFAEGEDTMGQTICSMSAVMLSAVKNHYEEKHDSATFVKSVLSDNIMLNNLYVRAKELHIDCDTSRGVLVLQRNGDSAETLSPELVQRQFPDRQSTFVLSMGENEIAIVQQLSDTADLEHIAADVAGKLSESFKAPIIIGVGTVVPHLRDLARSYKEAQIAIEVGKVFNTESNVIYYENLGIGRLIYQLPTALCEMFLQEVFKKKPLDALDKETLFTINKFFENNLVLSETSRKLFVHRNTLVYRLEKIRKLTGLDLRNFDDAITFKVALMVRRYLASRGIET